MCVGRRRYRNHARTGTRDRLVKIGECLWHPAALSTPTSALGVRTDEAHDFEAGGSQSRNVSSATEPCANN
jgi:hypothetical protein